MSHQRQRLVSNPTSPLPNGLGLMMNGGLSFTKGDFDGSTDFDYAVSDVYTWKLWQLFYILSL